jgi:hypothetical protein
MKEITAFPFVASDKTGMIINTGMTMRDYFAAQALPFALQECMTAEDYYVGSPAVLAYQYADAMMEARK